MNRTAVAPTLLWLHGWGTSPSVWEPVRQQLAEWAHEDICYSACAKVSDFAEQLAATVSRIQGPVVAIGWSMGGMLALQHLLAHPTAFQRAIIVSSTLQFVNRERTLGWPPSYLRLMQRQLVERGVEQTLQTFREQMDVPAERGEYLAAHDFSTEGLIAGLEWLRTTDLRERWQTMFAALGKRIDWIHGTNDVICPLGAIPASISARAICMEAGGHAPFLANPSVFCKHVRRLLLGYKEDVQP